MTSHALGRLAGNRRTLLHVQRRAAGGRHGPHLENMTSYTKEQLCQFSSRTDLKSVGFFEECFPSKTAKKKNKKISSWSKNSGQTNGCNGHGNESTEDMSFNSLPGRVTDKNDSGEYMVFTQLFS